jgi:hypothetical protein
MLTIKRVIATQLLLLSGLSAVAAAVQVHPVNPAESAGAPYAVAVDNTPVLLERVGEKPEWSVYYARYCGVDKAEVVVTVKGKGELSAEVEPKRLMENLRIEDRRVKFTATGNGPCLVFIKSGDKELQRLFVIQEPEEENPPKPGDAGVFNVLDYGVTEEKKPQTEKFQNALDACAKRPDGGVVYVPPGHYWTGTLHVRDNTYVYLAGGAVVQAYPDPEAFPLFPGNKEHGGNGMYHSFSRLLFFDHAENAGLIGRGTLDGSGKILRNKFQRRTHVIEAHESRDIEIGGVVARNSASWSVHLVKSNGIHINGLKVIADWGVWNSDGINPDSCRNVLVENVFCYTGDDSFAVKSTANSGLIQSSYNITIRDSVAMTRKTALKVGTETIGDISNVLYENIDLVRTSRAIGLWARDGGRLSNIIWRDIRGELVEVSGEGRSGQPFLITNQPRRGQCRIENVLIQKIDLKTPWYSLIESEAQWPVTGVKFDQVKLTIKPRTMKKEKKYLFEFDGAEDIIIQNLVVDWSQADPAQWKGLWRDDAPVDATNIKQLESPFKQ